MSLTFVKLIFDGKTCAQVILTSLQNNQIDI